MPHITRPPVTHLERSLVPGLGAGLGGAGRQLARGQSHCTPLHVRLQSTGRAEGPLTARTAQLLGVHRRQSGGRDGPAQLAGGSCSGCCCSGRRPAGQHQAVG